MCQLYCEVHRKDNLSVPKYKGRIYKKYLKLKNNEKTLFSFCKMYDILFSTLCEMLSA